MRKHTFTTTAVIIVLAMLLVVGLPLVERSTVKTAQASTVTYVQVPSFYNMSARYAGTVAKAAGFKVYYGKPIYSDKIAKHKIAFQAPAPRTMAVKGKTITLYESLGKKPKHKVHSWKTSGASWYWEGSKCADGGRMNTWQLYFAHKHMKFGTKVHFKYRGREAIAICRDRGPYVRGREFDLGPRLAKVLHYSGTGRVTWDKE